MTTKVKAIIPEGEAVQLQFETFGGGMLRIAMPRNSPTWFKNWAFEAMKQGGYERFGYIPMNGPRGNHFMTGATAGSWIIRGNDGQIMALEPEVFSWIYNRIEEDQKHG